MYMSLLSFLIWLLITEFVISKEELVQIFSQVVQYSAVTVLPPIFHTHLFATDPI